MLQVVAFHVERVFFECFLSRAATEMSFIHYTIVGHFDPCTLGAFNVQPIRPLDLEAANTLLAEFPPEVASYVEFHDGYATCRWAPADGFSDAVHSYAYRLAKLQNCVAAESPLHAILYPKEAMHQQAEAMKRLVEQKRRSSDHN